MIGLSSLPTVALRREPANGVVERLHAAAAGDRWRILGLIPRLAVRLASGKAFQEVMTVETAKDIYMPVSREQGRFMYLVARSIHATKIVEFGTSFGISTMYLAAALHENGGGLVVGTEMEPRKHRTATENLAEAGFGDVCDLRLGDAMSTLATDPVDIDMVLLDGWKDLYLPVLKLLQPRLAEGAVVLADNIHTFKKSLKPYVDFVQSGDNGFESVTLRLGASMEYSVFRGS